MYEPITIFNKVCVRVREGSGGEEMGGEGRGEGGREQSLVSTGDA